VFTARKPQVYTASTLTILFLVGRFVNGAPKSSRTIIWATESALRRSPHSSWRFFATFLALPDKEQNKAEVRLYDLHEDVRYAARSLRRSPAFTLVAIVSLAIGIGANTAVFSQVNAVFLETLPGSNPEQLRTLFWTSGRPGFFGSGNVLPGPRVALGDTFGSFSYPAYEKMRDGTESFSDLACWADLGESRAVIMDEVSLVATQFVSGNFFGMLGRPTSHV